MKELNIKLTLEELKALEALAKTMGVSVETLIKLSIKRICDRKSQTTK